MRTIETTAAAIAQNFHRMEDEGADFATVCETTRDLIADAAAEFGMDYDDVDGIVASYL